jgi:hypothetical protein
MVDNVHDTPDSPHDGTESTPREPVASVGGDLGEQSQDHELFAPEAVDHDAAIAEQPAAAASGPTNLPAPRKRRGFWRKFTLFLAIIGLLLTGGGVTAIVFKDKDERLRAISDMIDEAGKDPAAFAAGLEAKIAEWWKDTLALVEAETSDGSKPKAERRATAERAPAHEKPVPESLPVIEAPRPATTPAWTSPQDAKQTQASKPEQAPPPEVTTAQRADDRAEVLALVRRIEQLEATTHEAIETAREAQRTAKPGEAAEKPAASTSEESGYASALEGRIDELADEIRQLRDRLDQPKSESRVAPEAAEAIPSAAAKGSASIEILALAQSLQHALDHGRPFVTELAALRERGVDPRLLEPLASTAQQGAPTRAQLQADFKSIAKRLHAMEEQSAPAASLTDQLLHDAGKLVRVRPVGETPAASIGDLVARIETALAHDDLDIASEAIAKLPEKARVEVKGFVELLDQRREAEQAAAELLNAALAGLGHNKN